MDHEWGWCFFFCFDGWKHGVFFLLPVWTVCLQRLLKLIRVRLQPPWKCASMIFPGNGSCNARSWWSLLKSTTLMGCGCTSVGRGWRMDGCCFFLPGGRGRGWRKHPVADVENVSLFLLKWKKIVALSDGVLFLVGLMIKFFVGVPGWIKVERQNSFSGNPPETPLVKCSEHG